VVKCLTVEVKVTDLDIYSDSVSIIKEFVDDKRIPEDVRIYYENKVHLMMDYYEKKLDEKLREVQSE
jgi:ribosome recycling factor